MENFIFYAVGTYVRSFLQIKLLIANFLEYTFGKSNVFRHFHVGHQGQCYYLHSQKRCQMEQLYAALYQMV